MIKIYISSVIVLLGILVYRLTPSTKNLCDVTGCPYCIGSNLCKDFQISEIILEYKSFSDFFYNIFSVKNIYFAKYGGVSVVLKWIGDACGPQKDEIGTQNYEYPDFVFAEGNLTLKNFKLCSNRTFQLVMDDLRDANSYNLVINYLEHNAEPILMTLFPSYNNWPAPYFYGCCGQLIVVKNCGKPLNDFQYFRWLDRAYIALHLLVAAVNFTRNHEKYRLYLTDISPDNIVVDETLRPTFVDLENGLLAENTYAPLWDELAYDRHFAGSIIHKTEHFSDEYTYSEQDICMSQISDHNIYSVCRILLSKDAAWPMMPGGLLHSPPAYVTENYQTLFADIELCVGDKNKRFQISTNIINTLTEILNNSVHKYVL